MHSISENLLKWAEEGDRAAQFEFVKRGWETDVNQPLCALMLIKSAEQNYLPALRFIEFLQEVRLTPEVESFLMALLKHASEKGSTSPEVNKALTTIRKRVFPSAGAARLQKSQSDSLPPVSKSPPTQERGKTMPKAPTKQDDQIDAIRLEPGLAAEEIRAQVALLFNEKLSLEQRSEALSLLLKAEANIEAEAKAGGFSLTAIPSRKLWKKLSDPMTRITAFLIPEELVEKALSQSSDQDLLQTAMEICGHLAESTKANLEKFNNLMLALIEMKSKLGQHEILGVTAAEHHARFLSTALNARLSIAGAQLKFKKFQLQDDPAERATLNHYKQVLKNKLNMPWFKSACLEAIMRSLKRGVIYGGVRLDYHFEVWQKWSLGTGEELASQLHKWFLSDAVSHDARIAAMYGLDQLAGDYSRRRPKEQRSLLSELFGREYDEKTAQDERAIEQIKAVITQARQSYKQVLIPGGVSEDFRKALAPTAFSLEPDLVEDLQNLGMLPAEPVPQERSSVSNRLEQLSKNVRLQEVLGLIEEPSAENRARVAAALGLVPYLLKWCSTNQMLRIEEAVRHAIQKVPPEVPSPSSWTLRSEVLFAYRNIVREGGNKRFASVQNVLAERTINYIERGFEAGAELNFDRDLYELLRQSPSHLQLASERMLSWLSDSKKSKESRINAWRIFRSLSTDKELETNDFRLLNILKDEHESLDTKQAVMMLLAEHRPTLLKECEQQGIATYLPIPPIQDLYLPPQEERGVIFDDACLCEDKAKRIALIVDPGELLERLTKASDSAFLFSAVQLLPYASERLSVVEPYVVALKECLSRHDTFALIWNAGHYKLELKLSNLAKTAINAIERYCSSKKILDELETQKKAKQ